MKKSLNNWTAPYCGVSHYETENYLCTVIDWERFAEAHIYRKPVRIADCKEEIFKARHGISPTENAKKWCMKQIL